MFYRHDEIAKINYTLKVKEIIMSTLFDVYASHYFTMKKSFRAVCKFGSIHCGKKLQCFVLFLWCSNHNILLHFNAVIFYDTPINFYVSKENLFHQSTHAMPAVLLKIIIEYNFSTVALKNCQI